MRLKQYINEEKVKGVEYLEMSSQRYMDLQGTYDKKGKYIDNIKNHGMVQTANPHLQFFVIELKDGRTLIDDQRGGVLLVPKWFDYIRFVKKQTELLKVTKGKTATKEFM